MPILRPYQSKWTGDIRQAWAQGAQNVVAVLPTGGGKTVGIGDILSDDPNAAKGVIAHREELVGQLSLALARNGIRHDLIAPDAVKRNIARLHMRETGRSYFAPGAPTRVAGIDTLVRRGDSVKAWASSCTRVVVDEGHHVIRDNKWGTGMGLFSNPACKGLFPTATPERPDGKGLGRWADGLADAMIEGPPPRWLIDEGFLTDYRVICPPSDMELLEKDIGASGDWSTAKLRDAARASHIVGDLVEKYIEFTPGSRDITFCPDVETATKVLQKYIELGIRAAILTGKTEGGLRQHTLRRFEAGDLDELVVVDIVSEGFDMPAVQSGGFGRKTASLITYLQQFGRLLRPLYADGYSLGTREGRLAAIAASVKPKAVLRDHVGNFLRHGPPDRPRVWSLNRRIKRRSGDTGIPMRICIPWTGADDVLHVGCYQPYERIYKACKWCKCPAPPPESRGSPAMVEGDMRELDSTTLALLRGAIDLTDMPIETYREHLAARRIPVAGQLQQVKIHFAKQIAQVDLRNAMDLWAGQRHAAGATDSEIQREFFLTFGIDVMSAQALDAAEANTLRERVWP